MSIQPSPGQPHRAVTPESALQLPPEHPKMSLPEITSVTQYLVLEHFDDFHLRYPSHPQGVVLRAFSRLLDGSTTQESTSELMRGQRNPIPVPGLDVTTRSQLGIHDYPYRLPRRDTKCYFLRNHAIRAGSLVDYAEELEQQKRRLLVTDKTIISMSAILLSQFED